jgi:hypothetical protein
MLSIVRHALNVLIGFQENVTNNIVGVVNMQT